MLKARDVRSVRRDSSLATAQECQALYGHAPHGSILSEALDGVRRSRAPGSLGLAHQEMLELLRDALKPYVARYALGRVLGSPADLELEKDSIIQPDLFVVPASLSHAREWTEVTSLLLAID